MFELYNDKLVDLLAPKGSDEKLEIKLAEHSSTGMVEVKNSVEEIVPDINGLLDLFKRGAESRTVASTQMNADSSRSHLITMIVTKVTNKRTGNTIAGKLTLVDLAGSERVGKSGAEGAQLKEAQSINKSLSALGDVISALTTGHKHIPYRNSPLTMLMSDSIGGNAKVRARVPTVFRPPDTRSHPTRPPPPADAHVRLLLPRRLQPLRVRQLPRLRAALQERQERGRRRRGAAAQGAPRGAQQDEEGAGWREGGAGRHEEARQVLSGLALL